MASCPRKIPSYMDSHTKANHGRAQVRPLLTELSICEEADAGTVSVRTAEVLFKLGMCYHEEMNDKEAAPYFRRVLGIDCTSA